MGELNHEKKRGQIVKSLYTFVRKLTGEAEMDATLDGYRFRGGGSNLKYNVRYYQCEKKTGCTVQLRLNSAKGSQAGAKMYEMGIHNH